jgi:uracil-DNA glycosylase
MELKDNFEANGVLLLNTALVFVGKQESLFHARAFAPFVKRLLSRIASDKIELILFGNIAKDIKKLLPPSHNFKLIESCHPYNLEFITDKKIQDYFAPMHLLSKGNI